ncbi:helix-turn-helix transcriptional regulator [Sphingobacterium olei]|uniref:Helix-turn-helix transcriptional regulator n=1 Tax=Sphingobacterium olei TaxID=2571155 RepID=A0A4V5MKB5_9SPHI|nr:AraC family transcriptional regulator [Sphingobacterium olei]TJZ52528.1 helix-turn-helix transcriptional regulator [Sphingobacterium olei]
MIIDRKYFVLNKQCVIEKLLIKTPFKYGAIFQNEACFLYVKNGESTLKSPTENLNIRISESVLLKCGNYFADLIQNSKQQQCEIYAIHLHSEILKEVYKNEIPSFIKPEGKKSFATKIERQDVIVHFIESLDFYFQNPTLVNDELIKLKIKELVLLLLQTKNAENLFSLFAHLFTPRQASLKEIIRAHLFSNLTVGELATLSDRSLSAFKRDFESYFNDTPANYIKKQKLLKAIDLLIATDFSIAEICYKVGFSDTSHFTKLFKRKYNSSPAEYRKNKVLK